MITKKELLLKIKAMFELPAPVPPAPAPAPVPPAPATPKAYKLQDGTDISITQAGELPAPGDMVTINGIAAPAGTLVLQDGATVTTDAMGMVTAYAAAVVFTPPAPAPAPVIQPAVPITQAQMEIMFAKFATGSTEDRIGNLETMCKLLMECNYGYKIREASEDAAIQAYKDSVASQVSSLMAENQKVTDDQNVIIKRHEATITGLFELVEKLVELPTDDPKTLTGNQKARFEKMNARDQRLTKMAEHLKTQKSLS